LDEIDRNALSQSEGEDALRFAPNFSVYVLPPDTVCLYSEDRKVFLDGKLYCALAERIGAGEPQGEFMRALAREFPAAEIEEAVNRLLERGFVLPPDSGEAPLAGYWASLALPADLAADNLQTVGVGIESMDAGGAAGADELAAALRGFGVRIVDLAADLIVVLTADALDARLAPLNEERLAQGQDWLLVQPTGLFPLVGPIFRPGRGPCWACLAHRMSWNRQIKAFLDRGAARCVASSALADSMIGRGGIALAALEIAKAIASGFRTDLTDRVVSFDLTGSTVARHYVPRRPQCPACGRAELRDPARTPVPVRIRAGGKWVATGAGVRAVTPAATVARYRKHVSPLTGIVAQLEPIKTELPRNVTWVARHSLAPRPQNVEALKAGPAESFGQGTTTDEGEASALMQAIERYCGVFQGDEIRTVRRFTDFAAGDAIPPDDVLLLSAAQRDAGDVQGDLTQGHLAQGHLAQAHARRFDPSAAIEWSPVWSLSDERFKYLPTGLLYEFHPADERLSAGTGGCAAGNTIEEAIVQGFLELVERDACAIWWYNRLQRCALDLAALGDTHLYDAQRELAAAGWRVWALDVTSDLAIPAVVAVAHGSDGARERVLLGCSAHFDMRIAARRAVAELNRRLTIDALRKPAAASGAEPLPLRRHAHLLPHGQAVPPRSPVPNVERLDRREQVLACLKIARRHRLDLLVLEQTRPDLEVPVARVIVPGLRPFARRLAGGRLYDVPVALGLRKRPLRESDLNPLDPPI
jgi:oxazoline/thiazoline synthase